LKNIFKQHIV